MLLRPCMVFLLLLLLSTPSAAIEWQLTDVGTENLNNNGAGNIALWCGQSALQQPTWTSAPGYGNDWDTWVYFSEEQWDSNIGQTVTLEFSFNHDLEPEKDFFYVEYDFGGTWTTVCTITGSNAVGGSFPAPGVEYPSAVVTAPIEYFGGDYGGPSGQEVMIRLRLVSDDNGSDEDGGHDGNGAVMIDDIYVVTAQGTYFDDFESGANHHWKYCLSAGPTKRTKLYALAGTATGEPWTWVVNSVPASPWPSLLSGSAQVSSGSTALQIAEAFAGSINALCRQDPTPPATAGLTMGVTWLQVDLATPAPFTVCVEGSGGALCCPVADVLSCNFNPLFEEVPFSGEDCNQNGQDDMVDIVTGVSEDLNLDEIPDECVGLSTPPRQRNHLTAMPNPFNPTTLIRYEVAVEGMVDLSVYDLAGREVVTLFHGVRGEGTHLAYWHGRDQGGAPVVSGTYVLRYRVGGETHTKKLVLVR